MDSPFGPNATSSKLNSSIDLVFLPYGRRARVRGIVSTTNRESSLSRNDIHFVYSTESTMLFRSRGLVNSCQLSKPSMRGEAAARNGQNAAAATPEMFSSSAVSSG